jgi:hypothetical protein
MQAAAPWQQHMNSKLCQQRPAGQAAGILLAMAVSLGVKQCQNDQTLAAAMDQRLQRLAGQAAGLHQHGLLALALEQRATLQMQQAAAAVQRQRL